MPQRGLNLEACSWDRNPPGCTQTHTPPAGPLNERSIKEQAGLRGGQAIAAFLLS